jgi:signal transduction histidine kinase
LEPTPGLGQLPELTATFAGAGLDVEVTVEGEQQQLSPGSELTAFRIVQEALTNVTKHANTNTASVRLAYGEDRLTITVTNGAGPATPTSPNPGEGFGIVGMRERVQSAGGQFRAVPRPEGGFTVATELPIGR